MSSDPDPAGGEGGETVTTTTLPDGTRRVVTTTLLPNGTRTTTRLLPSLPVVTTETTRLGDGSGSTVKETTSVVHPGGRREVTIVERFVPSSSSSSPPAAARQQAVASAEPASTTALMSSVHQDNVAGSPLLREETQGQVEEAEAKQDEMPEEEKEEPLVVQQPRIVKEPAAKEQSVLTDNGRADKPKTKTSDGDFEEFLTFVNGDKGDKDDGTTIETKTETVESTNPNGGDNGSDSKLVRIVNNADKVGKGVDPKTDETKTKISVLNNPTSGGNESGGDPKTIRIVNNADKVGKVGKVGKNADVETDETKTENAGPNNPTASENGSSSNHKAYGNVGTVLPKTTANKNERDSGSGNKFRSGWSSTPKVPQFQSFVPPMEPRETAMQRRRREEKEAAEAATRKEREEEEARRRLAEDEEVGRLEREKLAAAAVATEEAGRLERERFAAEEATRRAEQEREAAEEATRQAKQEREAAEEAARRAEEERAAIRAELDRLERERIEREKALLAAQQQQLNVTPVQVATPAATNGLEKAEEGAVEPSPFSVDVVEEGQVEDTEPPKSWWQRNKCRCSGLLLLLLIAGIVGLAFKIKEDFDDEEGAVASWGTGGAAVASAGDETEIPPASAPPISPPSPGDVVVPIALVVDRTCEYRKSQTVYVSVIDNGVDNGMYGGISDFDGDNAVVVSTRQVGGIGAVWALSKSGSSWSKTAFQTDDQNRFGWDVALSRDTIVVGAPDGGRGFSYPSGRGIAVVVTKDSGGSWYTQKVLSPRVADDGAEFGISVDISDCGCYIAVGAWNDKGGRGSVYVFSKTGSVWTETQKLSPTYRKAPSGGNYGHTVAISDTFLAVKAPYDYMNGVRGVVHLYKKSSSGRYVEIERISTPEGTKSETYHSPQVVLLDGFVLVGAPDLNKVYVFKPNGAGVYQKTTELTASDRTMWGSSFGVKIGGRGTDVLVSDRDDDSTYLFSYEDGVWKEKAKFDGYHAALSGNSIVVHSPFEFELNGKRYGGQISFYDLICS